MSEQEQVAGGREDVRQMVRDLVGEQIEQLAAPIIERDIKGHRDEQKRRRVGAIGEAMSAVMQAVAGVGKHGRVSGSGQNYTFRGIDDVINALGAPMREYEVMLQSTLVGAPVYVEHESTTSSGAARVTTSCRLVLEVRFTSLTDGSTLSYVAAGEGRDTADKATSKAMSMALKYALVQALALPTDEPDPDADRVEATTGTERRTGGEPSGNGQGGGTAEPPGPVETLKAIRAAKNVAQLRAIHTQLKDAGRLDAKVEGRALRDHIADARGVLEGSAG